MGCLSIQDSKNRPKHTKNLCLSQSLVPNGQPVLFFFWAQNQGMSILLFIAQFLIEVYWEPWDCPINQCLINQCWVVLMLLLLLLLWLLPLLLLLLLLLLLRIPLVFQQPFGKWPFADWCFCVVCVTYGSIAGISRTSFPWSCALTERLPARLRANLNKSPLRLGRDMLVQVALSSQPSVLPLNPKRAVAIDDLSNSDHKATAASMLTLFEVAISYNSIVPNFLLERRLLRRPTSCLSCTTRPTNATHSARNWARREMTIDIQFFYPIPVPSPLQLIREHGCPADSENGWQRWIEMESRVLLWMRYQSCRSRRHMCQHCLKEFDGDPLIMQSRIRFLRRTIAPIMFLRRGVVPGHSLGESWILYQTVS